jgi:hypothetical protein
MKHSMWMTAVVAALAAACTSGTHLAPVSARAELNQQRAAVVLLTYLDGGPPASLAETIYCSARANSMRAGTETMDASIPCPQQ